MLQNLTVSKSFISVMILMVLLMTSISRVQSKAVAVKSANNLPVEDAETNEISGRQFLFLKGLGRETSTPDFIRLVLMRFIYGLASSMGVEERLEGLFNGAFVPPNADGDLFGFGALGGGGEDDGAAEGIAAGLFGDTSLFDESALEGLLNEDF